MRYDWDEDKRRANLAKHGLDFADVERLFDWDTANLFPDDAIGREDRVQAHGYLRWSLVVVVYTLRGDTVRLISMRLATPRERRLYHEG